MRESAEICTLFQPRFQLAPGSDGLLAKTVAGVGKCRLISIAENFIMFIYCNVHFFFVFR